MSGDTLTRAVSAADLPALVSSHFPESRAVAGKAGRVRCTWRSDSRDLNGALFRGRGAGVWRLHDFVTGENWDAFSFCTDVLSMTKKSAASYLIRLAGLEGERDSSKPRHRPAANITTARDDLPDLPKALESWRRVWAMLGQPLRLELQGAEHEALEALGCVDF